MNNEELEKKIEFIIGQQAQFSVGIKRLKELHTQAESRMTRMENIIVKLYKDTDAKFNALIDSQMRLVESQGRTDERLNAFVNVVERYISGGRDGKSEDESGS